MKTNASAKRMPLLSREAKDRTITYAMLAVIFAAVQLYVSSGKAGRSFTGLLVPTCVYILAAMSLNLVVGVSGELSLGAAGFMCLGAFTGSVFSILTKDVITATFVRFPLAILLGAGYFGISASSFCFGLAAVFVAYLISRVSRTNPTTAMILAGMMISSLFSAGTSFIKLVADTDQKLPAITYWLLGSLTSIKQRDLLFLSIPFAVGMLPLLLLRWRLNLLTVGEDEARAMGVNTTLLRLIVVICATLLTAASVSVSGMIGWVGLIIPHICRMLFGYDYRRLIPASAMLGAAFLLVVDDAARLVTTNEIPLGILTAFIGAPLFLYLILSGGGRHAD